MTACQSHVNLILDEEWEIDNNIEVMIMRVVERSSISLEIR